MRPPLEVSEIGEVGWVEPLGTGAAGYHIDVRLSSRTCVTVTS